MAVRQYGMVEVTWREDLATDQAKVLTDVRVTRLGDEARMAFRVHARLVHPRVQGSDIDVMDLLTWVTRWYSLTALVRPPQKASRGLRGSVKSRVSRNVRMSGEVSLRRSHSHSHISITLYPKA